LLRFATLAAARYGEILHQAALRLDLLAHRWPSPDSSQDGEREPHAVVVTIGQPTIAKNI